MKTKVFSGILISVLLLISLVSALNVAVSTPAVLTKSSNTTSFTLTNNGANSVSIILNTNEFSDGFDTIPVTATAVSATILPGAFTTVNIALGAIPSTFDLGTYNANIIVVVKDDVTLVEENKTVPLTFTNSFCKYGDLGTGIEITRIRDEQIDNVDEWEWHPLDNIEVSVKVKNNLDDKDFTLEYGLYDSENNEFVDLDEDTIDFSIDEDESDEVTIEFQIPADIDFDSSSKKYDFYVKVYEEDEEDTLCLDRQDGTYFQEVEIKKEKRNIVIDNIDIVSSALCGDLVELNANMFNIGREDEDRVKVTLTNSELGINQEKEFKNFDMGDEDKISFSFTIPENAAEKTYYLTLRTFFDYDEDDETYDEYSEDTFDAQLKVEGGCINPATNTGTLALSLETPDTEIIAGNNVIIKATVQNTGKETTTYAITVNGNEIFSSLVSINPSSITLNPGQTGSALITLKLNEDAEGDQVFTVKSTFGSQTIEQPARLIIESSSGNTGITGSFLGGLNFSENWPIWTIVAINIILIIAIIIVAIRVSRA